MSSEVPSNSQLTHGETKTQEPEPLSSVPPTPTQSLNRTPSGPPLSGICSPHSLLDLSAPGIRKKNEKILLFLRPRDAAAHVKRDKPNHMENVFSALVRKHAKT